MQPPLSQSSWRTSLPSCTTRPQILALAEPGGGVRGRRGGRGCGSILLLTDNLLVPAPVLLHSPGVAAAAADAAAAAAAPTPKATETWRKTRSLSIYPHPPLSPGPLTCSRDADRSPAILPPSRFSAKLWESYPVHKRQDECTWLSASPSTAAPWVKCSSPPCFWLSPQSMGACAPRYA